MKHLWKSIIQLIGIIFGRANIEYAMNNEIYSKNMQMYRFCGVQVNHN